MKFIRKLGVVLLSIVLYGLIGALFLSFAIKDIVQNKMVGGVIKDNIVPNIIESADVPPETKHQVEEIIKDEEFNQIVDEMVSEILESMGGANKEINQDTINNMFDYLIENKDVIEEATGQEINVEEIEALKNSDEVAALGEQLTEAINETSSQIDESDKAVIKTYTYIVSDSFRNVIMILIVVDLLLIAIIQWSFYKWLAILGRASIASGVSILVLFFISTLIINELMRRVQLSLTIDNNSLFFMGIILLVTGLVLVFIKKFIDKMIAKKEAYPDIENNEITQNNI